MYFDTVQWISVGLKNSKPFYHIFIELIFCIDRFICREYAWFKVLQMDNCHIEYMYRLNTEFLNTTEVYCNSLMHGYHSNINGCHSNINGCHININLSMTGILCACATYRNRIDAIKTAHLMLADQKMPNFNNRYYIGINIKLTIYCH